MTQSGLISLPLDPDACYQALRARDARFDGHFFVGVSSTGIYCRPVCPVRPALRANCSFFVNAAAAEALGFRPCLRCRPELAPGVAAIDAAADLASRAATLIEDGALDDASLSGLAVRLGVSDRHLRRVFVAQMGVSPIRYAQTQRLLLAKRLLTDTALPITDVAMSSGFSSLRRFNALFVARYRMPPSRLRQMSHAGLHARADLAAADAMRFELAYRPPFAWDALLDFLRTRAIAGVEAVDATHYYRVVRLQAQGREHVGWIAVGHCEKRCALEVNVDPRLRHALAQVLAKVRRLFDLAARPQQVARVLGALAISEPGLRVPGAFDGFELAVRAILGQQVSVKAARTMAGRFASRFGSPVRVDLPESVSKGLIEPQEQLAFAFPCARMMAGVDPRELLELGVVRQRATAIIGLATALSDGRLSLEPGVDVNQQIAAMCALPGIGDWTAQYIAMRALSWPDAFPASDLILMRALGVSSANQARNLAAAWSPWRAYAVMHLWRSMT